MEGVAKLPIRSTLIKPAVDGGLGLAPEMAGLFIFYISIAWFIKAFYWVISDNIPIFKYRRKSWLLIMLAINFSAWIYVATAPQHSFMILVFTLLIINFGFAFSDVAIDGYMIETGRRLEKNFPT